MLYLKTKYVTQYCSITKTNISIAWDKYNYNITPKDKHSRFTKVVCVLFHPADLYQRCCLLST